MKWICVYLSAEQSLCHEDIMIDVASVPEDISPEDVAKEVGNERLINKAFRSIFLPEGVSPDPLFFEIEESIGIAIDNLPYVFRIDYSAVSRTQVDRILLALCRSFEVVI